MLLQRLNPENLPAYLEALRCEKAGVKIMSAKGERYLFALSNLSTPAAMILKQECLALGADLALPREAILCQSDRLEGILIANAKQLTLLSQKCKLQPFGLKALASELQAHLKSARHPLRIMGILNATPDSFYEKSRFQGDLALKRIEAMIEEGADIIDIGAASTRPGSEWVSEEEELRRIRPLALAIKSSALHRRVAFSIDTYNPKVAELCLDSGFAILNDITALRHPDMVALASERQCEVAIMHMQGDSPRTMQENPHYENVILELDRFFSERLESLQKANITRLILDVGIGFGKNLEHNLKLIRHLSHFQRFGLPLLLGASRKSLINALSPAPTEERLAGTLLLHAEGYKAGASVIRCHDVKEHVQAFKVLEALESTGC